MERDREIDAGDCQANFGKVEELVVCANLGDHMIGNVYVKVFARLCLEDTCPSLCRFGDSKCILIIRRTAAACRGCGWRCS